MNTSTFRIAALVLLAGSATLLHAEQDNKRWIQGSWVNVRSTAATDGPVIDHLVTNTPVVLRGENGKSCEIGWSKDGNEARGFVPCRLLGDRALTVADVGRTLPDGKENPQYSPLRLFWIAPSMEHLFMAGQHFRETLIGREQNELENAASNSSTPPRLVRYPVPEFDAMKAVLAKGIVAPGGSKPWARSCDEIIAANAAAAAAKVPDEMDHSDEWRYAEPECKLDRMTLRLPPARPSLFKSTDRLMPGSADVEAVSAGFGIVERGKTIGGPQWRNEHDSWMYTGAWDIGRYELTLDKPVVEHVIGRTGLVGAYQWTPKVRVTPNFWEGCAEGLRQERHGKEILPGYPAIKDALLWFEAPQALPFKTAKIKSRVERAPASGQESLAIKRVVVSEIDLNGDGVPDFVQWDIWATPAISGPDPAVIKRETYVNIDGRWYPLGHDIYHECT